MSVGYRLTQEELLYLSYAYSLQTIPSWLPEEIAVDEEEILISLEKKDLFFSVENHFLPSPLIGFLFESMATSNYTVGIGDAALCYCSDDVIVLVELIKNTNRNRLTSFDGMESLMCYLQDLYLLENVHELFAPKDSSEASKCKQQFNQLWRKRHEC